MFHCIQKDIQIDDVTLYNAKQGHGEALCLIANQYYLQHTHIGYVKSMEWYFKSAATCYTTAMYHIGHLFMEGKGTTQNYQKAFEWFKRAADLNHSDAKQELERLKDIIHRSGNENNAKEFTVIKSIYHEIQHECREREIEGLRIERIRQDQLILDMEAKIQQMRLNNCIEESDAMIE
ncbi:hypothetical protein K501DRAFT_332404 [Backusella circina FSU 941]|nr:hypothetical protein K501DRAFT_332404 [Backusella circina FSU 941]